MSNNIKFRQPAFTCFALGGHNQEILYLKSLNQNITEFEVFLHAEICIKKVVSKKLDHGENVTQLLTSDIADIVENLVDDKSSIYYNYT